MPSSKNTIETIINFVNDLRTEGIDVSDAVLFGSYAKGTSHEYSDIDLAIWSKDFVGDKFEDIPMVAKILCQSPKIELHPFAITENASNHAFINEVILKEGITIDLTRPALTNQ